MELAPEVQEMLARANISPAHARSLVKITNVEQQIAMANQVAREGWTVKETEKQHGRGHSKCTRRGEKQVLTPTVPTVYY